MNDIAWDELSVCCFFSPVPYHIWQVRDEAAPEKKPPKGLGASAGGAGSALGVSAAGAGGGGGGVGIAAGLGLTSSALGAAVQYSSA